MFTDAYREIATIISIFCCICILIIFHLKLKAAANQRDIDIKEARSPGYYGSYYLGYCKKYKKKQKILSRVMYFFWVSSFIAFLFT